MSALKARRESGRNRALRGLAWCEFDLIEACHQAAYEVEGEARALLMHQVGAAQVHLFDLDSVLRDGGGEPVRYARCIRHAMLSTGRLERIRARRADAYRQVLERTDLSPALRRMLRLNAAEVPQVDLNRFAGAA